MLISKLGRRLHVNPKTIRYYPDVQIRDWIKNGKFGPVPMPALGDRLTDTEVEAVIAYIKSLWPKEQRDFQESINQRYPTPAP